MGKLCVDQLIWKIVPLLREADPEKFDEAVTKAKSQLSAEQDRAKRSDLEKLFDAQLATLRGRGVPDQILELLRNQRGVVLKKAGETAIGKGNVPFLPAISRLYLSPYSQIGHGAS